MRQVVRYEQARRALEEARRLDEVKDIADKAKAMASYARQANDPEMELWLADIRFLAYERLGEISLEFDGGPGGRPEKNRPTGGTVSRRSAWKKAKISLATGARAIRIARAARAAKKYRKRKASEGKPPSVAEFLREQLRAEQVGRVPEGPFETCTVEDLDVLVSHGARFGTVYADPPWQYGNQGTRAATDNHYVTMTVDEIAALPTSKLVADDAHLHLWTTNAFLFDAKTVLEAWGFEYKSCFIWVKPEMGIGNYWRVSHEFMLLGVRGRCPFRDRSQMSWMEASRTRHSAKPAGVRSIIEKVSSGPYLELFGREAIEGWTVWGNEIQRGLFTQTAEKITG